MVDGGPGTVPIWQQDQWDAADAHRSRWRLVVVLAAAVAWIYPSLFAWLLIAIGVGGMSNDTGVTVGMLDGGAEGLASFVSGLVIEVFAGAGLVFVSRWAIGPRPAAVVVGVTATVWLQVLVSWAVWL